MTLLSLVALCLLSLAFPKTSLAHAFGQLYNLPVPFWLYLYGASAAIIASFLVIGFFISRKNALDSSKILIGPPLLLSPLFINSSKLLVFMLFALTIFAGLVGADNPRLNFNMTFFWVIFVLGFSYFCAIFGNIWSTINPIKNTIVFFENISGIKFYGFYNYPKKLSYYPALVFYFIFIWIELLAETSPKSLSLLLLTYTIINFIGTVLWGKISWFKYCEFFSLLFRLIGKLALFEKKDKKIYIRPPIVGLLNGRASHLSQVIFIIFMLASTAFDGFKSTKNWQLILNVLGAERSFLSLKVADTLGLILAPILFLYIYFALIAISGQFTKDKSSTLERAKQFAFSLVPIALVYNVAHYYSLIFTEGQNIIKFLSDPFGFGWNILGTAGYKINYALINANVGWHFQVAVIIAGHIASVYLAHMVAMKTFPNRQQASLSQIPMLILMVIYTVIGLWILAQPIVTEI